MLSEARDVLILDINLPDKSGLDSLKGGQSCSAALAGHRGQHLHGRAICGGRDQGRSDGVSQQKDRSR